MKMKSSSCRRLAFKIFLLLIALLLIGIAIYQDGFRTNFSNSVPPGIWHLTKTEPVVIGSYVDVKATSDLAWYALGVERNYYPSGRPLLKKVAALEGGIVDYDPEEKLITINGIPLPDTEIFEQDSRGRSMLRPIFPVKIKKGEVWLTSENQRGYDSRYYGPVPLNLLCVAHPIILW